MKKQISLFFFLFSLFSFSQTKVKDTVTRRANITYNQKANAVKFKPETPPLIPIAVRQNLLILIYGNWAMDITARKPNPNMFIKTKELTALDLS